MNDDQYFLANAYLDGELTVDERRIAEADPEVMTEVGQLRALQDDLRAVPAPADAAREAAITAAMAEFAAVAAPPSTVTAIRPRPAASRYLAIAAAIVAVAGLGIVVSRADFGGGDDDSNVGIAADATADAIDTSRQADLAESAVASGDEAVAEMAPSADAGGQEMAAAEVAAEDSAATMGDEALDRVPGPGDFRSLPPDFDPDAPLTDDDQLGLYGVYLVTERDAGMLPPTPNTACDPQAGYEILDETTFVLDGSPVPVYVAVRDDTGSVLALDTDTCDELVMGSLVDR